MVNLKEKKKGKTEKVGLTLTSSWEDMFADRNLRKETRAQKAGHQAGSRRAVYLHQAPLSAPQWPWCLPETRDEIRKPQQLVFTPRLIPKKKLEP